MYFFFGVKTPAIERAFAVWRRLPRPARRVAVALGAQVARARLRKLRGPARVVLFVTNRCTRRCDYCLYYGHLNSNAEEQLSLTEMETLASSLPERLVLLTLTGGEPLLRPDLAEIAVAFRRLNRTSKVSIVTNGDLPEQAERAVRRILERCSVTLDLQVSIQAVADLEQGTSTAETLSRFVALSRRFRCVGQVAAQTTVGKDTLHGFPDLLHRISRDWEVVHKFQFVRGVPGQVFLSGPGQASDLTPPDFREQALSRDEQRQVLMWVREWLLLARYPFMARSELVQLELAMEIEASGLPQFPCQAGELDCVVFEDGRLSVCENLKSSLSLRDYGMDLAALWRSESFLEARKPVRGCACTHPCNLATSMMFDARALKRLLA